MTISEMEISVVQSLKTIREYKIGAIAELDAKLLLAELKFAKNVGADKLGEFMERLEISVLVLKEIAALGNGTSQHYSKTEKELVKKDPSVFKDPIRFKGI